VTYYDVSQLSEDADFRQRCTAALATEQHPAPEQQAYAWRWLYAGFQPIEGDSLGNKYAYAVLNNNPAPGRDPAVITDADILEATQKLMAPPPEPEVDNELPE
jgi:hypothetical protein